MKNLLSRFYKAFEKAYDRKLNATGLAVFRMAYGLVLFFEISQIREFKELRFDYIPFLEAGDFHPGVGLLVWQVFAIFLIIGFKTRFAAVVNYCFTLLFLAVATKFEYDIYHVYTSVNLILIFLPISKSLSVDRMIKNVRYSRAGFVHSEPQTVNSLHYFILVFVAIGFVYMASIWFKFNSSAWMNGLGMWKPAILSNFNIYGDSWVFHNEFISRFLGYLTLVFECVFIFLMWFKKPRLILFVIGFSFHIGIFLIYPIPWFGLGVSAIYLLMVPVSFWRRVGKAVSFKKSLFTFIYDDFCPICAKTVAVIKAIDIFNGISYVTVSEYTSNKDIDDDEFRKNIYGVKRNGKLTKGVKTYVNVLFSTIYLAPFGLLILIPGIYHLAKKIYRIFADNRIIENCSDDNCVVVFREEEVDDSKKIFKNVSLKKWKLMKWIFVFSFLSLLQLNVSMKAIITDDINGNKKEYSGISAATYSLSHNVAIYAKLFLGITNHPVFQEGHFSYYEYVFALEYEDVNGDLTWLPIVEKNGQPGTYNRGGNWANWNFRACTSKGYDLENLERGSIMFSSFWAHQEGVNLNSGRFKVMLYKQHPPEDFSDTFPVSETSKEWTEVGELTWSENNPTFEVNEELLK